MPLIPDKRNDMKEIKYKIQTPENSYVITIRTTDTSILIYIGGKYSYCLECQLFTENSFMARIKDITLGDLPHVYYQDDCALDNPFLRGDDTKRILYLLISYIKNTLLLQHEYARTNGSRRGGTIGIYQCAIFNWNT